MDPGTATCRPAPASRPPARVLLEPLQLDGDEQPTLPWTSVPQGPATSDGPDPALRQLAAALVSALVEVLAGQRSALQLERWVEPDVLSLVEHLRRAGRAQGVRVRSVRVQAPGPQALEVAAHLQQGDASRAAALRIGRRRGQWVATHLSIALRPPVINQAGWISPFPD